MKRQLLLSLVTMFVTAVSWADVAINETNFPDANFRSYLINDSYSGGSDGVFTDAEIQNITSIWVSEKSISSLQGIEYFTALKYLSCYNNQLTSLDVSKNTALTSLNCSNNQLTSLDVSKNTALTSLSCSNNQLTTLNISGCTALQMLYCQNNKLTSIDLSTNPELPSSDSDISNNPLTGVVEGSCGSNARFSLNLGTGAFSVTGTGAMNDNIEHRAPYYIYTKYVKTVNIANGITRIGRRAFRYCRNLTSVSIPNSVTSIGDEAFGKCDALTSFTLPNSVTEVGDWIFEDVDNFPVTVYNSSCFVILKNSHSGAYTIPAGIKTISGGAFADCEGLTAVTIPNSVTTIGEEAFAGCIGLTSVTIPNSVTSISKEAFAATGLTSVTIPNSVTTIGDEAFEKCTYLETVVFPNSVVNIGNGIFQNCPALKTPIYTSSVFICLPASYKGAYTVPAGIKTIAASAFNKCKGLTSVIIPDGVTTIGENTFNQCTALTSVNIPNGVTSIGSYAFSGCSSLASIVIPEGVTSIGSSAFSDCNGLKSMSIPSTVKSFGTYPPFYDCRGDLTIACNIPSASAYYYSIFDGSHFSSVNIANGVTSVGDYAFYISDSLKTVTIPASVNYIGTKAFCSKNLKGIYNYAATPQSIDGNTFYPYSTSVTLHVKHGYKDVYKSAIGWKEFTIIDDLYDNVIYAKETSVQSATFNVPIVAKHSMKVSGFSFNFKCPAGFTVKKIARGAAANVKDDEGDRIFDTFRSNFQDGMYYVDCFYTSLSDYFMPASEEDELAIITLEADIDAKNGEYPLVIIEGELAYEKENDRVDYYETPLHFEFLPGDANGDGRISVADITSIASYLLKKEPEVFYKNAAAIANGYDDVDNYGEPRVSVGDITAIGSMILKKESNK